ncbi:MAG: hypothetical protein Q8M92_03570 [Candidatus Subteraquimicrobiales bacterium]|nr:hypothetical protein [Candidatus Subteraquimicrobiales bacterium]
MHRTQIYLDETRYQYLVNLARRQKKSIAQVIRELVDEHVKKRAGQKEEDSFFKVIGIAAGTGEAIAERYEDVLYG